MICDRCGKLIESASYILDVYENKEEMKNQRWCEACYTKPQKDWAVAMLSLCVHQGGQMILPFMELVNMISIYPESATIQDITEIASELSDVGIYLTELINLRPELEDEITKRFGRLLQ